MQHPDLTLMIHESMRRDQEQQNALPRVQDQLGPISTVRALMGNALIGLGTRIKPMPRKRPATTIPVLPLATATRTRT